jgi:hypothetical protein
MGRGMHRHAIMGSITTQYSLVKRYSRRTEYSMRPHQIRYTGPPLSECHHELVQPGIKRMVVDRPNWCGLRSHTSIWSGQETYCPLHRPDKAQRGGRGMRCTGQSLIWSRVIISLPWERGRQYECSDKRCLMPMSQLHWNDWHTGFDPWWTVDISLSDWTWPSQSEPKIFRRGCHRERLSQTIHDARRSTNVCWDRLLSRIQGQTSSDDLWRVNSPIASRWFALFLHLSWFGLLGPTRNHSVDSTLMLWKYRLTDDDFVDLASGNDVAERSIWFSFTSQRFGGWSGLTKLKPWQLLLKITDSTFFRLGWE